MRVILNEYHLGVVHGQIDRVETALHFTIEFHRLLRGLQVCQEDGMCDQAFLSEVEEPPEEGIRRGESRHIDIRTPSLLQDPVQQAERVETFAQIALQGALGQRSQQTIQILSPGHRLAEVQ